MIEPFTVHIADAALEDTRARLRAARWIADPGEGAGGGASLGFAQRLARYWLDSFDWRALEARINAEANFIVEIDGLRLHAVHRRSSRADAVPLLLIHGWPSSFLEFLHLCEMLAEPAAGAPAFHVIVPSLPGYGFSQTRAGVSPRRIAGYFGELMAALGYERFLVQGGNWGSSIAAIMAREQPGRLLALHLNAVNGSPPPPGAEIALSPADRSIADTYATLLSYPHFNLLVREPLAVAHAMNDSPAGIAAWLGAKLHDWADTGLAGNPALSPEWAVSNAALYWFTGTAASSQLLYREAALDPVAERYVEVPTAVAHFAAETVMIPRPWAERHYAIMRWTRHERGGHYPAIEVPDLFVEELRSLGRELGPG